MTTNVPTVAAASAVEIAKTARAASQAVARATAQQRNALLRTFADCLASESEAISKANAVDRQAASGLSAPMRERLCYDGSYIAKTITGIEQIILQDDPIGQMDGLRSLPSGIQIGKMRIPLGVILMIYESRPSVTADAAALALKSGNAIILRGGSEAHHTNQAIGKCLDSALQAVNLPAAAQVVRDTDRAIVGELLQQDHYVDLVIPRGGRALIERVSTDSKIAMLKHLDGNCHIYVDATADLPMAEAIVDNAKTRRYGVCNAAESLLVHADVAQEFLPRIAQTLAAKQVELRVCAMTQSILAGADGADGLADATKIVPADEADWAREYLAAIISVKVVASLDEAITHINHYGSGHTDAIITNTLAARERFVREVDSSSVIVNASTAFADGGEYGLGAEIGISTNKLHARGPVGMLGLTTQKYVVFGNGETRK